MFEIPNISIPIVVFLIIYAAYMLFYIVYSLFNVYHLARYGVYGFGLYIIITVFAGGTILLVTSSFFFLADYNWLSPVTLNNAVPEYNNSLFPNL